MVASRCFQSLGLREHPLLENERGTDLTRRRVWRTGPQEVLPVEIILLRACKTLSMQNLMWPTLQPCGT